MVKKYSHDSASHGLHCRIYRTDGAELHWHEFYELELILSGEGTHTLNGRVYPWRRGGMHLLRLTDLHRIETKESEVCLLQIDPGSMPPPLLSRIAVLGGDLMTFLEEEPLEEMAFFFRILQKEEDPDRRKHLLHLILGGFLDLLPGELPSVPQERMGEILLYIGAHFREPLTPASLASHFYMNKTYFCSCFKKYTGKTTVEYLTDLRLEYAATLAATSDLSSTALAEAAGFGSLSHFLRCFKKKFGVSPTKMFRGQKG